MSARARVATLLVCCSLSLIGAPEVEAAPVCAVTTPIGSSHEQALGLAVQTDGKIVVVGYSIGANENFAVVRYKPDLTLDTSFGAGGIVTTDFGSGNDRAYGVAIQPDGKIVVVGSAFNVSNKDIVVARYNANGTLDFSFDGDGKHIVAAGSGDDELFDVAIQPDGKIVAVGRAESGGDGNFLAVRFTSTGPLDPAFPGGGILTFSIGSFDEAMNAVAIQPDGKIVLAGTEFDTADNDVVVARLNGDGSFDSSFGMSGIQTNSPALKDNAKDVAIQSDGKIVIVGDSDVAGNRDITVMRLTSSGFGDSTFNSPNGFVQTDLGSADIGEAIAVQDDGKIVVAGYGGGGAVDMWALRYDSAGALDTGFDGDGKASLGLVGATPSAYAVGMGPSGSVYVAGSVLGPSFTYDFAIGRLNSDGSSPCTEVFFHPVAQGSMNSFNTFNGCTAGFRQSCVNDQAGDAPTGAPVADDNVNSRITSTSSGARDMFRLITGMIPSGAIVNRIEIYGKVGKQSGGNPTYRLSYRMGGPYTDGPPLTSSQTCCFDGPSWIVSGIAWTPSQFDTLEIGAVHVATGTFDVSQLYVKVTYMLSPPQVNYRSIGTAPDYWMGTVTANLNSEIVIGTGTQWRTARRGRGDRIEIDAQNYTILEVDSETQLRLTSPFLGTSGPGKAHIISRQHPSPNDWEGCIDGGPCAFFTPASSNLISDNRKEVGIIYDDGSPYYSNLVISGSVTDATHDIVLTAHPADRHFGKAGAGVAFDLLMAPVNGIEINDQYVTIDGLEIRNADGTGIRVTGAGRVVLRNNLMYGLIDGIYAEDLSGTALRDIYNNIVYGVVWGIYVHSPFGPSANVLNNTVFNGAGSGISGSTNTTLTVRNNIAHSFASSNFNVPSVAPSSSNNLSSDATASSVSPGGGARPNIPLAGVDFVSTTSGSEDLHIKSGSAAKNMGATLSLFNTDIDEGQRPAVWDIGADEFGVPLVNYFSIGTNPGILASGSASVTLGSTTVTFSTGLPANVGIGDKLVLDPGGVNEEIFYVLSVDTATQVTVQADAVFNHAFEFFQIRRAFNTLQDWESAREGDLVSQQRREVGVVYNDGVFFNGVVIDGSTTDPTYYMTLTVAAGQRHLGVAGTGAGINGLDTSAGEVTVSDPFTVVEWLEITRVRGATAAAVRVIAPNVLLSNLIAYQNRNGTTVAGPGGASFTIRNSVLYRNDFDGIAGNTASDSVTVQNCAVFGNMAQGLDSAGSPFNVTNTMSMSNLGGDFVVGAGSQSHNMSSDATAPGAFPLFNMIPTGEFVSITLGAEDFHLRTNAVAADDGLDLSSFFQDDVDGLSRPSGPSWDRGADEVGGGPGGPAPGISSSFNQNFTVGSLPTPAATVTILEDPTTPTITAADDLRIRIPSGFPMRFDPTQTTVFVSGPAFTKVSTQVKAYEDLDQTVVLDVVTDFAASDQVDIDGLRFRSFTAPEPASYLQLEVSNDDAVSAVDDKTIAVFPDTFANLSSDDHQVFTQLQPPTTALPFTISEGTGTSITPTDHIRVRIPAGFNMTWDSGGVISFGGPAAPKVGAVAYEDSFRTLKITVNTSFVSGEYVTVSGARFQGFFGISPVDNLRLDVGVSTDVDDKTIEIREASDVVFFTATAKDQEVKLEWLAPAGGDCDSVLILRRNDGIDPAVGDGVSDIIADVPCTPGNKYGVFDGFPLFNGTLYHYAAFVSYGVVYTPGKFVKARPMDSSTTNFRWAYSTGASSMAAPGLRLGSGASYVYAVSNDSILHSMKGGDTGGVWPSNWTPYELGGPAQNRPPVVPFQVGSSTQGVAFLGSQDGSVYVIDANDGSEEWRRPIATMVQAAPAGYFPFGPATPPYVVLVGTRNGSAPNSLEALDLYTGIPAWSFNNSVGQGGDGKEIGVINGSAAVDYQNKWVFFTSNARTGANGSNRTLWCVNFSSGSPQLRWSLALGNIDGSPVLWGNVVYVGTKTGVIYAVDRNSPIGNGTINWSYATGNGPVKGFIFPQAGSNRVLFSTTNKVWSMEDLGLNYNVAWSTAPDDIPLPSTPVFVPGTGKIVVGSGNGRLYQLDAFSPSFSTWIQLGDGSSAVGVPTVDIMLSMIYVGTDEGAIYGVAFPLP